MKLLEFPKGSFVIFDRACSAVKWFAMFCQKEIFFVTSFKKDMKFKVVEKSSIDVRAGITSDYTIAMDNGDQKVTVRKIGYRNPETSKHYVFLTNNFCADAKATADLYKARWQIEVFFKEMKQFLKIRKFVGTNENAVKIQIYTALIVYLLLAMQKFLHKAGFSIGQMFQLFQLNLIGLRTIEELLRPKINKTKNYHDYSLLSCLTT